MPPVTNRPAIASARTSATIFLLQTVSAVAVCAMAIGTASATGLGQPVAGKDDWQISVGGGARYAPDYEGSDDYAVSAIPFAGISWRDTVFFGTVGGPELKVNFFKLQGPTPQNKLILSTTLGYSFGRDEDDNDALDGLGDIDGGLTVGLSADYQIGAITASLAVEHDATGDRDGTSVEAELQYSLALAKRTRMILNPSVTWADDAYMSNSFGITAMQASRSSRGLPAFDAGGGLKDAGLTLALIHRLGPRLSLAGQVEYTHLLGDAADSPIVAREGDEKQYTVRVGLTYRW